MTPTLMVCGAVVLAPVQIGFPFIEKLQKQGLVGLSGGLAVASLALLWAKLFKRRDRRGGDIQPAPEPLLPDRVPTVPLGETPTGSGAEGGAGHPVGGFAVLPEGSLRVGFRTDIGAARELNEDSYLILDLGLGASLSGAGGSPGMPSGLYVVADGMGGYDAGEVASGLAVQVVARLAREAPGQAGDSESAPVEPNARLKLWVEEANRAVFAARRAANSEMGTTLVAALVLGEKVTIANVGDSRCYHLGPAGIRRVTVDHSLVERLVATGQITRAEAESHPQRNFIYRAIGDKPAVDVDLYAEALLEGEALLLCSDGLCGMVPDEHLLQLWTASGSPQEACDRMVAAANQAGGDDNITAVIVQGRRNES